MSRHSFDAEIAREVGIPAAVLFDNIRYWIEKNAANGSHVRDGKVWTYNSMSAFAALFPYMTVNQIRRALEKLEEVGLIESGNHNETAYDRTKWYCLSRQIHLANLPNRIGRDAQPIPDSKPDTNPDGKPDTCEGASPTLFSEQDSTVKAKTTPDLFDDFWKVYPPRIGTNPKSAARKAFAAAVKKISGPKLLAAVRAFAEARKGEDARFTPMASTWLNQERWEEHVGSAAGRPRMNPDNPMEGIPEADARIIRYEIDPERRDADARAWWARREAAE